MKPRTGTPLREGQFVYHGTSTDEGFEDLRGPAWVSDSWKVAKSFVSPDDGSRPRVITYRVVSSPRLVLIDDEREFNEMIEWAADRTGREVDDVWGTPNDLADAVCETRVGGWHAPANYPEGSDTLLCDPSAVLEFVKSEKVKSATSNPPKARVVLGKVRRTVGKARACYPAAEVVYHAGGGRRAGLTPVQQKHEGVSHWWVRGPKGEVLDPASAQFRRPVPYERGRGRGFLTAKPSQRARALAKVAGVKMRRNSDDEIRRLEREARLGDPQAQERLRAVMIRTTGIVPESHRIGMAVSGVFTPHGSVLCLACDGRFPQAPATDPESSANARCDACGVPVYLSRDDVALLQNMRDELRLVHGIEFGVWQTGGMCAALGRMIGDVECLIAVDWEAHVYVVQDGRVLSDRYGRHPDEYTYQQFGFAPDAQWTSVPTGMLEWHVGATGPDGYESNVVPSATLLSRTVGEGAVLLARHFRRAGPAIRTNSGRELRNPHFLDSTGSAIKWALKNVGDAREDYPSGSSSHAASYRMRKELDVEAYVDEYRDVVSAGQARIWRAVEIPAGEDPRLWIDWDEVGTHWSFRRSGAGVYSGGKVSGPTQEVVIEAAVKADEIDWDYGFTSFWYYGQDQFECALKPGARVEIVAVGARPAAGLVARANPSRGRYGD